MRLGAPHLVAVPDPRRSAILNRYSGWPGTRVPTVSVPRRFLYLSQCFRFNKEHRPRVPVRPGVVSNLGSERKKHGKDATEVVRRADSSSGLRFEVPGDVDSGFITIYTLVKRTGVVGAYFNAPSVLLRVLGLLKHAHRVPTRLYLQKPDAILRRTGDPASTVVLVAGGFLSGQLLPGYFFGCVPGYPGRDSQPKTFVQFEPRARNQKLSDLETGPGF
eukprot:917850-Rhodomonas_salina.1